MYNHIKRFPAFYVEARIACGGRAAHAVLGQTACPPALPAQYPPRHRVAPPSGIVKRGRVPTTCSTFGNGDGPATPGTSISLHAFELQSGPACSGPAPYELNKSGIKRFADTTVCTRPAPIDSRRGSASRYTPLSFSPPYDYEPTPLCPSLYACFPVVPYDHVGRDVHGMLELKTENLSEKGLLRSFPSRCLYTWPCALLSRRGPDRSAVYHSQSPPHQCPFIYISSTVFTLPLQRPRPGPQPRPRPRPRPRPQQRPRPRPHPEGGMGDPRDTTALTPRFAVHFRSSTTAKMATPFGSAVIGIGFPMGLHAK